MDGQKANIADAVDESTRQAWEWFRNAYDLYLLEAGVPGEDPIMPAYESLSEQSRAAVRSGAGAMMIAMSEVGFRLPEVKT